MSAVDADPFEGPPSEVARIDVAPLRERAADAFHAEVTPPDHMACRVDDGPWGAVDAPVLRSTVRAHTLRCASAPDSAEVYTLSLPATLPAGMHATATLTEIHQASDTARGEGTLRVALLDGEGRGVPELTPTLRIAHDVTAAPLESTGEPGVFRTHITWPLARLRTPVELVDASPAALSAGSVALYEVPPPPPPPQDPPEVWRSRVALRLEGSAGLLLSSAAADAVYDRDVRAGLRVGVPLARPLIAQVAGVVTSLGADTQSARVGVSALVGLRFEPRLTRRLRLVVDAAGGLALGQGDPRPELEAGAGVEFAISRGVGVGPLLRYDRVFAAEPQSSVSAALSVSLTPWP